MAGEAEKVPIALVLEEHRPAQLEMTIDARFQAKVFGELPTRTAMGGMAGDAALGRIDGVAEGQAKRRDNFRVAVFATTPQSRWSEAVTILVRLVAQRAARSALRVAMEARLQRLRGFVDVASDAGSIRAADRRCASNPRSSGAGQRGG